MRLRRVGATSHLRPAAYEPSAGAHNVPMPTFRDHGGPPMRPSRRALLAATATATATLAVTPTPTTTTSHANPLRTGFEQLQASGYAALQGRRVGVVTNPTG